VLFGGENIAFEVDRPKTILKSLLDFDLNPNPFWIAQVDLRLGDLCIEITMLIVVSRYTFSRFRIERGVSVTFSLMSSNFTLSLPRINTSLIEGFSATM